MKQWTKAYIESKQASSVRKEIMFSTSVSVSIIFFLQSILNALAKTSRYEQTFDRVKHTLSCFYLEGKSPKLSLPTTQLSPSWGANPRMP